MRKIVPIVAMVMSLGALTILTPGDAQARFGAGAIAEAVSGVSPVQPAQYYRGYRQYPNYYGAYGAYAYAPSPNSNYWYNAPARIYSGSREALDTCALC